ncbi:VOC family protein [Brevibacterium aurantiacum]|uniref:VOC family protein n=1 Tax=Brevibacterium aurantiacum TaxID=273384 RepID=A0A556CMT2_BREAU|nr:VOC family protein [Brevibacterium aurantiacum]TSI18750.1 VOC family protein [Brevibacterium aurantiacum]
MFTGLMASITVTDQGQAHDWYSKVFERGPDATPMPGLLEWHFGSEFGVQVWTEPQRAGYSTAVIGESDLDALAEQLAAAGIDHGGPQPGGGQRILPIADPDGNRIVFSGE